MIQELQKENKLYREYIATLEKQIQANHQERNVLCRTVNGLGQEINTLSHRVSTQSSIKIKEAALQHFQQLYKKQCNKTTDLKSRLDDMEQKYNLILQELSQKQRRIQQLNSQNIKMKDQIQKICINVVQKQQKIHNYDKQIQFFKRQSIKNEENISQIKKQNLAIKQKQRQIQTLKKNLQQLQKKNTIQSQIKNKLLRQKQNLVQQKKILIQQKNGLITQKTTLVCKLESLEKEKIDLQAENTQIDSHLKQAKIQVQELNSQLKQYLTTKISQKDKTKTLNPRQSQQQFNHAFQQLKIQISAIKKDENQGFQKIIKDKIARESKENIVFDLNSPSKWKSIQSKLSLLRNAQSINRLK